MAQECQRRRPDPQHIRIPESRVRFGLELPGKWDDQCDGQNTLEEVEYEDEGTKRCAENAGRVGRADVPAAGLEQIDAAHAADDVPEWDCTDEIRGDEQQHGRKQWRHAVIVGGQFGIVRRRRL